MPSLAPLVERPNRIGQPVLPAGDPDELAAGVLVGLRSTKVDQRAGRLAKDVLDLER